MKTNTESKIKYVIYCRKSSDNEDRQMQSIEDQLNGLKKLAFSRGITINEKDIFTESKSAKKPNNRPVFEKVLKKIERGEAQGIFCWQINRLSRNPVDSGKIGWMLQQGIIQSIQTIDKEYRPEDNVLLFSVETGMANQFIIDLKKVSWRGMEGKADRGWLPSRPPIGYLNAGEKENEKKRIVVADKDRFDLVRKMWDLMLTGAYTPPKILEIATKEWGLLTPKCGRMGNKEICKSGIYKIFNNIFYTGLFDFAGKRYEGKHQPMITTEEYNRVQRLLGKAGRPRPKKHEHAYTGVIECEECGCMHTASTKVKTLSTGEVKEFCYYYCTRHKKNIICSQKQALTEKELENQIEKYTEQCEIMPQFLNWALEYLNERNDTEIEDRAKIHKTQQETYNIIQNQIDNLTRMRYRDLIDDDSFLREVEPLKNKLLEVKKLIGETENRAEKWLELTEQTFKFTAYAQKAFLNPETTLEEKRNILLGLGWNHKIKDKILSITKHKWLTPIINNYSSLKQELDALELDKTLDTKGRNAKIEDIRTRWGAYSVVNLLTSDPTRVSEEYQKIEKKASRSAHKNSGSNT